MNRRYQSRDNRRNHSRPAREERIAAPKPVRTPPTVYGPPFIVLEDESKNTFTFDAGNWVPHSQTIAECRQTCQVKELSQKVNRMVRYEVRRPIEQ